MWLTVGHVIRAERGAGALAARAPLQNRIGGRGDVQIPGGVAGAGTLDERGAEYMRGCWTGGGMSGWLGTFGGVRGALGGDRAGGRRGGGRTGGGVRGSGILLEDNMDGGVGGPGTPFGKGDGLRSERGAGVRRARSLRGGVDALRADVERAVEDRRLEVL